MVTSVGWSSKQLQNRRQAIGSSGERNSSLSGVSKEEARQAVSRSARPWQAHSLNQFGVKNLADIVVIVDKKLQERNTVGVLDALQNLISPLVVSKFVLFVSLRLIYQ
jgi:hypothetical protein